MRTHYRHVMVLVAFSCVLAVQAATGRIAWREGIKASDSAFWQACKENKVMMLQPKSGSSSDDVATNVKAKQANPYSGGDDCVSISYDAITEGSPVNVSVTAVDYETGETIPCNTFGSGSDVGLRVPAGRSKFISWDAKADWGRHYSKKVKVNVIAVPADNPETWAVVTIAWASFGGRDLDVCGYWVDRPDVKVGWSYGTGSTDSTYRSTWRGDNTGSGPEYINIGVVPGETLSGVTDRRYRIHCNYFGSAGSSSKATLSVTSSGITKSKTISVSNRSGSGALTSDPFVTITFDENGQLVSIE